ncbi:helicase-related protein, partial [Bacillus cereus group sp. Bce009]
LKHKGFSVIELHGDLEQRDRDQALVQFANKSISILVATDVAARGLDVDNLDAVFNFELSRDPEVHVHRIGRTGRAGSQGLAISFFSDNEMHR